MNSQPRYSFKSIAYVLLFFGDSLGSSMRTNYPGLDVVRFWAALSVTVYHLGFWWWEKATDPVGGGLKASLDGIAPFVSSGWVGVPVFFILSGFVIAFSAEGRPVKQFVIGRASRLYPAVWICAPITAAVIAMDPGLWQKLGASLVLWPFGPWVSAVYWTLAVEIEFYFIVALALSSKHPHALRRLGVGFAGVGSAYWILRAIDSISGKHLHDIYAFFEAGPAALLHIESACHFAIGLMLWSCVRYGVKTFRVAMLLACVLAGIISVAAAAKFNVSITNQPSSRILIALAQ